MSASSNSLRRRRYCAVLDRSCAPRSADARLGTKEWALQVQQKNGKLKRGPEIGLDSAPPHIIPDSDRGAATARPPAGSFPAGFRTPALAPVASSVKAGIRNPQHSRRSHLAPKFTDNCNPLKADMISGASGGRQARPPLPSRNRWTLTERVPLTPKCPRQTEIQPAPTH